MTVVKIFNDFSIFILDSSSIKCSARLRLHTVVGLIFFFSLSMMSLLSSSIHVFIISISISMCANVLWYSISQSWMWRKILNAFNEFTVYFFF
jgi:hypothetical protein